MAERPISLVDHTDEEEASAPLGSQSSETSNPDSQIDVLYENQRGWFVFGIPLFSSNALWNSKFDAAPWADAKYKPSAVNITNAQVPDPSWTWEWKSWYVDMSQDVDEEGWQYSFWFRGAVWHGNHPWFHSFVRRRRWLRKRVKQKLPAKMKDNKERLFGDTFSIPTTIIRASTVGTETHQSGERTSSDRRAPLDEEITDVGKLMHVLKASPIDREKIAAINKFIEEGGEELHYLPEQMHNIMSMLLFQNSRRQLLAHLMDRFEAAKEHREEHKRRGEPEDTAEERKINNLLRAVEAADAECKKLEYWSDIRKLAEDGKAGNATDPASGWDHSWEGLDRSGPAHP
ncbi:uncharacterized protein EI97DRAFT_434225 [Westerdykella ornata]|uniref:Peroxin/Ferlin domain-containing protein n=1 Tax=Westerdykella ornata TaxID=318751 RepID=A0A6A6JGY9_WESOR|nr:uncharacterized protein EI97DRAFT_434225 [Westerdykella ornata]KAF2275373.1 hypothetical protein EI97DRAFT_434225 [Westerdykella ornata]